MLVMINYNLLELVIDYLHDNYRLHVGGGEYEDFH